MQVAIACFEFVVHTCNRKSGGLMVGSSGGGDVPGRCDALSFVVAVGDRWSRIRDASGSFIVGER